ncbi:splicing regulator SDE2 isoform X1 [Danio rerio]|uniref:Replication stress response regulator SDE2 n=1 Tax=Danio rerio TaxID=7955 RepID=A0A8M3AUU4_DANRE|nr:protein SDE2 homolog isoform X1 [Danio rerio]|eukprot:XP_009294660.1 protein SDE2 homolog isoform X1 [Danio rerio]
MELFVISPDLKFNNLTVAPDSTVSDLIDHFTVKNGVSLTDFYVSSNGRLSRSNDLLQSGVVYRLEPRLCGGKGGFGSMLRALGAQIEKTTNREACRDLSGRRLRDVNHEKEMAEWLKKQADREAEKEQRRLERIQRKLAEPKHYFTDTNYEQQCHDLSERLEDSVLKGMQASSSGLVQADEGPSLKRANPTDSKKKAKKKCYWTGMAGLEEMASSSEGSDDSDSEVSPSTSGASCSSGFPKPVVSAHKADPQEQPSSSSPAQRKHNQEELQKRDKEECTSEISSSSSSPAANNEKLNQEETNEISSSSSSPAPKPTEVNQQEMETEMECTAQISSSSSSPAEHSEEEVQQTAERVEKMAEEVQKTAEEVQKKTEESTAEISPSSSIPEEKSQVEDPLDLLSVSGPEQLEALGLERLKKELMERGMKCGGTLQERAARLFSVKGLTPDQIDPSLLAKPSKGKKK